MSDAIGLMSAILAAADGSKMSATKAMTYAAVIVGLILFAVGGILLMGIREEDEQEGEASKSAIGNLLYGLMHPGKSWHTMLMVGGGIILISFGSAMLR